MVGKVIVIELFKGDEVGAELLLEPYYILVVFVDVKGAG